MQEQFQNREKYNRAGCEDGCAYLALITVLEGAHMITISDRFRHIIATGSLRPSSLCT